MSLVAKVIVAVALLGVAAIELSSPLVARVQLEDAASDAANSAAFELGRGATVQTARAAADRAAALRHVPIERFAVDPAPVRTVHVTVSKEARSYLLKRFGPTRDWYHVTVTATAVPA